jgi:hypothetical protein
MAKDKRESSLVEKVKKAAGKVELVRRKLVKR